MPCHIMCVEHLMDCVYLSANSMPPVFTSIFWTFWWWDLDELLSVYCKNVDFMPLLWKASLMIVIKSCTIGLACIDYLHCLLYHYSPISDLRSAFGVYINLILCCINSILYFYFPGQCKYTCLHVHVRK